MSSVKKALVGLAVGGLLAAPVTTIAQSEIALKDLWRIQGTATGTERALEPYLALTEERLFIGGSIQIGQDRRQAIQVFDADTGAHVQTIEDPTGEVFAGLGDVIAANTRFMVTSTYRKDGGALQVFDASTGQHLRSIPNPRAADSSRFGQTAIAMSGSRVMAGVTSTEDNQSTVWVFDAETGEILQTLDEPLNKDGSSGNPERTIFGIDKALTPRHALISAWQKDLGEMSDVGAAFLFDAETADLLHTFWPADPQPRMSFGLSVALSDTMAFVSGFRNVGELNFPVTEISAFDLGTGDLRYRLQDPYAPLSEEDWLAGRQGSGFAADMQVSNGLLIIGSPDLSTPDKGKVGAVHIHDAETGKQLFAIDNISGAPDDNLGLALVVEGARLGVVSSPATVEAEFFGVTRVDMFEIE
ncbi:MAG: hypothetical protein AAF367_01245 [Pseudomonadota bacterium]